MDYDLGITTEFATAVSEEELPLAVFGNKAVATKGLYEHALTIGGSQAQMFAEPIRASFEKAGDSRRVKVAAASIGMHAVRYMRRLAVYADATSTFLPKFHKEEAKRGTTIQFSPFDYATATEDHIGEIHNCMTRCLFLLSLDRGYPVRLSRNSPLLQNTIKEKFNDTFRLASDALDLEAISYFTSAQESNLASIQYLNFYQVLETLFVRVGWERAREEIRAEFISPSFGENDIPSLNRLIKVGNRLGRISEREQLKLVLQRVTSTTDIRRFLDGLDRQERKRFTTRTRALGMDLTPIDSNDANLFSSLAARIYEIRCAIVHSKDDHMNDGRYIPNPECELDLIPELPLVRYVSQEAIIKGAAIY